MAKKSDVSIPKYLKLAKGAMWFDINGPESSGIRLIKSEHILTTRNGKTDNSDIPLDKYDNKSIAHGDYGIIKNENPAHYFETTDIPKEKMRNIMNAFNEGILVEYDNKKEEVKQDPEIKGAFEYNKDGDIVFIGKNKDVYQKLNKYSFTQIKDYIEMCGKESKNNLMDMYHYEKQGYNPKGRPRFEVLELVRKKLDTFGGGISGISVNED